MHLERFPRIRFAHLPTPLEPLDVLSTTLGGPRIWIKRDDCTGLAGGGNKARKLEYLMADAVTKKADTIITHGATQSNHARQTAAAAAKMGMSCHLLLENRIGSEETDYCCNGNVFLNHLFGAKITRYVADTDMNLAMQLLAEDLVASGRSPYIIPGGGSNPVGALGYVKCALEILDQAKKSRLTINCVLHATGSAGTQAGLIAGFVGRKKKVPVIGIGVRAPRETQENNVLTLARATVEYLGLPDVVQPSDIVADCNYVGKGYGIPTDHTIDAIELLARTEGILLDPVYSGKGMAGLIDLVHAGRFNKSDNIIFVHTGGSPALFGYRSAFNYDL